MYIAEQINKIKAELPEHVKLVAVSKYQSVSMIEEAFASGQTIFGESKALEMAAKYKELPESIEWHFIGHLQTNKIKYIAPFVSLIHGVDSFKLLEAINKEARKFNRTIDCLLQFRIAREETKFGFSFDEAMEMFDLPKMSQLANIRIVGVMGMATFTDDEAQIREEFSMLKNIFDRLKVAHFQGVDSFKEISMGMSGDYRIAIHEGSTLIRIGTSIFGERNSL